MEHEFRVKSEQREYKLNRMNPFEDFDEAFEEVKAGENGKCWGGGGTFCLRLPPGHNDRKRKLPIELLGMRLCDSNPIVAQLWCAAIQNPPCEEMEFMITPEAFKDFPCFRLLGHPYPGLGMRHDVNGASGATQSSRVRTTGERIWFTIRVKEEDGKKIACHSCNAKVQWYKVRPDTKVWLAVEPKSGKLDGFTARLWTMTRANKVQTFSQQQDVNVATDALCASLESNREDRDQSEILAVWEIRDHKKDVHCRVALLHQDLENEDSPPSSPG